jgi:hypothetical protein
MECGVSRRSGAHQAIQRLRIGGALRGQLVRGDFAFRDRVGDAELPDRAGDLRHPGAHDHLHDHRVRRRSRLRLQLDV